MLALGPQRLTSGQGGVVPRLMASAATIVPIGDSRIPWVLDPPTSNRQKGGTDISNIAAAMSLQKYTTLGGFGQSGKRVDEYLGQLANAVALAPGVIFGWSFLNSIGQDYPTQSTSGASAAQLWIDTYKNTLKPAGIRLILCSEIGQFGMALVRRDQCDIANNMLQAFAATDGGFNFVDLRPILCTADRIVDPQYCYDASPPTHLNEYGAFKAAALVKTVYDQIMPTSPGYALQANGLPLIGNFTQLAPNPLFAVTTGGSTSTGATGTFAGSCTFNKTGTSAALAVASSAANVVLTGTFGAQADNVRMSQTVPTANWNSGDKLRAMAIVSVSSPVNLAGVQLSMVATGDSVATTYSDMAVTATFRGTDGNYRMLMMTQEYTMAAYTTKNSLVATITAIGFGAGSATVTVEQIGILKNNA